MTTSFKTIALTIFFIMPLSISIQPAYCCGGGGGGGDKYIKSSGTDGGPPVFTEVPYDQVVNPTRPSAEELGAMFGPKWADHNIRDLKTGMTKYEAAAFNQRMLEEQQTEADAHKLNMETALTTSKAAGYSAAVVGGVVSTVASGGTAGPAVTAIGIAGDGLAAGAGSATDSMVNKNKSFGEAVKGAIGPAVAKGAVSAVLGKVETGSSAINGALSTAGGMSYDEASSGAPNSAAPPSLSPAPHHSYAEAFTVNVVPKDM